MAFGCNPTAHGQVPEEVQIAFKGKYPKENDPDWRKDKNGNFESHFKIDGEHYRADFTPDGKWVETENNIKKKELPKPIQNIIKRKYKDLKIVEIEQVEHHQKGFFYDVEFKIDGHKKDVEFNSEGVILN